MTLRKRATGMSKNLVGIYCHVIRAGGGQGGHPPDFGRSINAIPTRGEVGQVMPITVLHTVPLRIFRPSHGPIPAFLFIPVAEIVLDF